MTGSCGSAIKPSDVADRLLNAKTQKKQLRELREELKEAVQLLQLGSTLETSRSVQSLNSKARAVWLDPQAGVYTGQHSRPPAKLPPPSVDVFREPKTRIVLKIGDPVNKPEDVTRYEVYDETNDWTERVSKADMQLTLEEPRISHGSVYTYRVCAVNGAGSGEQSDRSEAIDLSYSQFPPHPSVPSIKSLQLEAESQNGPMEAVIELVRPPQDENVSEIVVDMVPPRSEISPSRDIPNPHPTSAQEELQFPMSVNGSKSEPRAKETGPVRVGSEATGGPTVNEDQTQKCYRICDLEGDENSLYIRVPGLAQGPRYKFSTTAVTVGGNTSKSSRYTPVPAPEPLPGPPHDLKITDHSHKQVKLSWKAPLVNGWAVQSYQVQMCRRTSQTMETIETVEKGKTTAVVDNLEPNTEYYFRVCSVSGIRNIKPVPSNEETTFTKSHPAKRVARAAACVAVISVLFPVSVPLSQGYLAVKSYRAASEQRQSIPLAALETAGEMTAGFFLSPLFLPVVACKMAEHVYKDL